MELPKFLLYGQDDPKVENSIQSSLPLRRWSDLSDKEKQTALQQLKNDGWLDSAASTKEILQTVEYLNHEFLRQCPGKNLHTIKPELGNKNLYERAKAAAQDFEYIFLQDKSDDIVLRMLSKRADCCIDYNYYRDASEVKDEEEQGKIINGAFERFDRLANCLNHIFEQFAVNQIMTRRGFVPRQDEKITDEVYMPTLRVLADPKWRGVSADLVKMFEDYRDENYPEVITKSHSAVHRFLQILVGEEGKSGKGEFGKLFQSAKEKGLIPVNHFTEPFVNVIQKFIVTERATNSTSKPALKDATSCDALLMINMVMLFLQYCLQKSL